MSDNNLSHQKSDGSLAKIIAAKQEKIRARSHLTYATVDQQLELLDQLTQCECGRFFLETRGLNGFWTHYVVTYPEIRHLAVNSEGNPLTHLEDFMLNRAPVCLATQQPFVIFKREIQKSIQEGASLASIPCGCMTELLDLSYSQVSDFSLTGIDLDKEAVEHATQLAKQRHLLDHCRFIIQDAWKLNLQEEFDLIASHGLNIYEPNDDKILELHRHFFKALKPQGRLITSFLTPPPGLATPTEWNLTKINLQNAQLQKLLFSDILEFKWQTFRSEKQAILLLQQAGFENIKILYDEAHIFPTLIGTKN